MKRLSYQSYQSINFDPVVHNQIMKRTINKLNIPRLIAQNVMNHVDDWQVLSLAAMTIIEILEPIKKPIKRVTTIANIGPIKRSQSQSQSQ